MLEYPAARMANPTTTPVPIVSLTGSRGEGIIRATAFVIQRGAEVAYQEGSTQVGSASAFAGVVSRCELSCN